MQSDITASFNFTDAAAGDHNHDAIKSVRPDAVPQLAPGAASASVAGVTAAVAAAQYGHHIVCTG